MWQQRHFFSYLCLPLSWIFIALTWLRYSFYRCLIKPNPSVPLIVVGNITLGGTGKTPLVIYLAHWLSSLGFKPGIVLRGYKSSLSTKQVMVVDKTTEPKIAGDESVLLANKAGCPVVIGVKRVKTIAHLLRIAPEVNIILSDDGLQHYAMARTVEIVVIDGQKRFGNGFCLPAGPLREPISRLKTVDFIVANGCAQENEWPMQGLIEKAIHYRTQEIKSLADFKNQSIVVYAAIGSPQRFFTMLKHLGLEFTSYVFPDHYAFQQSDFLNVKADIILMTEKDVVKCHHIEHDQIWSIPLEVHLPDAFKQALLGRIQSGQKTIRNTSLPHL